MMSMQSPENLTIANLLLDGTQNNETSLADVLNDANVIQETKNSNEDLVKLFGHVSSELLTCNALSNALFQDNDNLREALSKFLSTAKPGELNPLTASFYCKIMTSILAKQPSIDGQVSAFICAMPNLVSDLMRHMDTSTIVDVIFRFITVPSEEEDSSLIKQFLVDEGFVEKLVNLFDPTCTECDTHSNAAYLWCELIRFLRDIQYNREEKTDDPLLYELQSGKWLNRLIDHMVASVTVDGGCQSKSVLEQGSSVFITLFQSIFVESNPGELARLAGESGTGEWNGGDPNNDNGNESNGSYNNNDESIPPDYQWGDEQQPSPVLQHQNSRNGGPHTAIWTPDPHFVVERTLANRIQQLFTAVFEDPFQCMTVELSMGSVRCLGSGRLGVVKMLAHLLNTNEPLAHRALTTDPFILKTLVKLFEAYPCNNFLHSAIGYCVTYILFSSPRPVSAQTDVPHEDYDHEEDDENENVQEDDTASEESSVKSIHSPSSAVVTGDETSPAVDGKKPRSRSRPTADGVVRQEGDGKEGRKEADEKKKENDGNDERETIDRLLHVLLVESGLMEFVQDECPGPFEQNNRINQYGDVEDEELTWSSIRPYRAHLFAIARMIESARGPRAPNADTISEIITGSQEYGDPTEWDKWVEDVLDPYEGINKPDPTDNIGFADADSFYGSGETESLGLPSAINDSTAGFRSAAVVNEDGGNTCWSDQVKGDYQNDGASSGPFELMCDSKMDTDGDDEERISQEAKEAFERSLASSSPVLEFNQSTEMFDGEGLVGVVDEEKKEGEKSDTDMMMYTVASSGDDEAPQTTNTSPSPPPPKESFSGDTFYSANDVATMLLAADVDSTNVMGGGGGGSGNKPLQSSTTASMHPPSSSATIDDDDNNDHHYDHLTSKSPHLMTIYITDSSSADDADANIPPPPPPPPPSTPSSNPIHYRAGSGGSPAGAGADVGGGGSEKFNLNADNDNKNNDSSGNNMMKSKLNDRDDGKVLTEKSSSNIAISNSFHGHNDGIGETDGKKHGNPQTSSQQSSAILSSSSSSSFVRNTNINNLITTSTTTTTAPEKGNEDQNNPLLLPSSGGGGGSKEDKLLFSTSDESERNSSLQMPPTTTPPDDSSASDNDGVKSGTTELPLGNNAESASGLGGDEELSKNNVPVPQQDLPLVPPATAADDDPWHAITFEGKPILQPAFASSSNNRPDPWADLIGFNTPACDGFASALIHPSDNNIDDPFKAFK